MSSVVFYCDACSQSSLVDVPCPICNAKMEMDYDEVRNDREEGEPVPSDEPYDGQESWALQDQERS